MSLDPLQLTAVLTPVGQLTASLQATGPAGAEGPPGPQGPAGPAGADGAHGTPTTIADEGVALAEFDILNFIGAGVSAAVDIPNNRINVTIPGGGSQTPWTSNIEAATFALNNAGSVQVRSFIELGVGAGLSGDRNAFIDIVGDDTYSDYGFRIIRQAGAHTGTQLVHRGSGALTIQTSDFGDIVLATVGSERLRVTNAGQVQLAAPLNAANQNILNTGQLNYVSSNYADATASQYGAAIIIRETNRIGYTSDPAYSPRICFFWNGVSTVQIGQELSGTGIVRTFDAAGTGYAPFQCSTIRLVLPSASPGAGTKQLWYDAADGNRVKYAV